MMTPPQNQNMNGPAIEGHVVGTIEIDKDIRIIHIKTDEKLDYKAGQYIPISWGGHEQRYYSIACAPKPDEVEIHIKRGKGAPSQYAIDRLQTGEKVLIGRPQGNNIYERHEIGDTPLIMIAGGLGFTPQKAMIEEALSQGHGAPLRFYWGVEDEAGHYMHTHFADLEQQYENFSFIPVLGRTVLDEALALGEKLTGFRIFLAGPPAMIMEAIRELRVLGVAPDNIHYDAHPDIDFQAVEKEFIA